jgi:low affinity Fe/Cu permease
MKIAVYSFALILIVVWSIGFIGYGIGGQIHILLAVALISVVLNVLHERTISLK